MNTKELIEKLQEKDPSGELEVVSESSEGSIIESVFRDADDKGFSW